MAKTFQLGDVPMKYLITYTDRTGKTTREFTSMVPDPKDPEKVREHLIETRNDFYRDGVTWDRLQVQAVGPMNAQDRMNVAAAMAGVRGPGLDPIDAPVTPQTVTFDAK